MNDYKQLVNVAYDVIDEERLPTPKRIHFKQPLDGCRKVQGVCKKVGGGYSISVTTTKSNFVEDEKGKYVMKNKGVFKHYRKIMGTERPIDEIKDTLAHEIAHLKFWSHSPEHKSYTKHLLDIINSKLGCKSAGNSTSINSSISL